MEDAIDFSPQGGVDLIVQRAIQLKIPDHNKRLAIQKMTGYNVNSAIDLNINDSEIEAPQVKKERRVKKRLTIPS